MRTIGMLGGMSWESTANYYALANRLVQQQLGGVHSAKILLDSVDFAEIEHLQMRGDWEQAGQILATKARTLQDAGAELLVLCTNTMHKVANHIEDAITVPLIHIADATAAVIQGSTVRTVALLGTRFTMEDTFLRERLEKHGLTVVVPDAADRKQVHDIIYDELVRGIISEQSRQTYLAVIARLAQRGAAGVILGCTEIELLINQQDVSIPVYPTTEIHVAAAVRTALA